MESIITINTFNSNKNIMEYSVNDEYTLNRIKSSLL